MKNNKILQPIETLSMTDQVENILRKYFEDNAFLPGDSLPGEVEIAERLEVSRNVVREALSRLRMLGIVETKTRRGMVMGSPDILGGFERVLNPYILEADTLKDMFEIRLILEMGMAEILMSRITEKDIEELDKIVKEQDSIQRPTKEEEIRFHTKLYEITGNVTFRRFQKMLFPIFNYVFSEYKSEKKIVHPSHVHHDGLVEILKKGSAVEFRKAMEVHLGPYFKLIDIN